MAETAAERITAALEAQRQTAQALEKAFRGEYDLSRRSEGIDDMFMPIRIESSHKIAKVLEQIFSQEVGKGIVVSHLILARGKKGWSSRVTTVRLPSNREVRFLEKLDPSLIRDEMITIIGDYKAKVKRYTDALLIVTVGDPTLGKHILSRIYKYGENKFAKVEVDSEGRQFYIDLCSGKEVNKELLFVAGPNGLKVREGVLVYGGQDTVTTTCTNGQVKRYQVTLRARNLKNVNMEDVFDVLEYGATRKLAVPREASSLDEISKLATRLAQMCAPSYDGIAVGTFALYCGEFEAFGYGYADGRAIISSSLISDMINHWLKVNGYPYEVTEEAVAGLGIQCRPWFCKVLGLVYPELYVRYFVKKYSDKGIIYIDRNHVTPEQQEEFDKLFIKSKKKDSLFWGKVVIISDDVAQTSGVNENGENVTTFETPDFFTDLNGLKESFLLSRSSFLNVLSHTHDGAHDQGKSSVQLVPSEMANGHVAEAKEFIVRHNRALLARQEERFMDDSVRPLSLDDVPVKEDGRRRVKVDDILFKIAREYVRYHDSTLYRSKVDSEIEKAVKRVTEFAHEMPGSYNKITADPAADFGHRILDIREDGSVEVVLGWTEKVGADHGITKRYPGPSIGTFSRVWFQGLKVIREKITAEFGDESFFDEKSGKSYRLADICFRAYKAQSRYGLLIIPAYKGLLNKHDGADFDGDACVTEVALPTWKTPVDLKETSFWDYSREFCRLMENTHDFAYILPD